MQDLPVVSPVVMEMFVVCVSALPWVLNIKPAKFEVDWIMVLSMIREHIQSFHS